MSREDGGPAFPRSRNVTTERGMSLRDYFAGQALAGVFASGWQHYEDYPVTRAEVTAILARNAYEIADAMLAARRTPESEARTPPDSGAES